MSKRFVKAADTSTSALQSRVELERVLRRYGATGFATSADYEAGTVSVGFRVPDLPGSSVQVPVRLKVEIKAVAEALGFMKDRWGYQATPSQAQMEQAERVAWRHLVLWVDAACSAASAGMQTMAEAFFAHALVVDKDGKAERMIDQFNAHGGQKLLASGVSDGN